MLVSTIFSCEEAALEVQMLSGSVCLWSMLNFTGRQRKAEAGRESKRQVEKFRESKRQVEKFRESKRQVEACRGR